jgi:hypothetical protein
MADSKPRLEKGGVEILEEAFHVLRAAPADLLVSHYIGSLPFVLGFLFFWAELSTGANAGRVLSAGALGLALLFGWMSYWQARFAARIEARLKGAPLRPLGAGESLRLAAVQTLAAAAGLLVLPLAAVSVLPLPFHLAFLQSLPACGGEGAPTLRTTVREAARQAGFLPRQNRRLLGLLAAICPFVLVNTAAAFSVIPGLFKTLLGVESIFGLDSIPMLNSTYLVTVLAVGYFVLLDPCIKAAYALRCFYGRARQSGVDLRADLNRLRQWRQGAGAAAILLALFGLAGVLDAGTIPPAELDRSIEEVLSRPEFTWRDRPEEQPREAPQGLIADILRWMDEVVEQVWAAVKRALTWLAEKLSPSRGRGGSAGLPGLPGDPKLLLMVLGAVLAAVAVVLLLRSRWRLRRSAGLVAARLPVAAAAPDLNDEHVLADQLPAAGWLAMAREMAEKGELRLAFRALFLGALADLAERGFVTIALSASNREYERELGRRAHDRLELVGAFAESRSAFERVWYGIHPIDREGFDGYQQLQERIIALASV